jgi:DNA-directed RNA polymerase delta subunit
MGSKLKWRIDMGSKDKEKSLLEIAIELLDMKKITAILKEVMEIKGVKASVMKELSPQFILDFMQSGYFVYCGDECWDLKDRQPTAVLDKESGDYDDIYEDDEDVKKNELKDDIFIDDNIDRIQDNDEDDDENEEDEIDDDLAKAFDDFDDEYNAGLILVDDNQEEENEDDDDN